MHFITLFVATIAGLAVASPVPSSPNPELGKRGVLIELCMAGCAAACAVSPPICAGCLVGCLGTGDDNGEVNLDSTTPASGKSGSS